MRLIRRLTIAALLVGATSPVFAQGEREWATHQLLLATVAVGFHVADWGQTRHIARSNEPDYTGPMRYEEAAPITTDIIGRVPTRQSVDLFMVLTGLGFLAAAHFLPEYRTAILTFWGITRIGVVHHNNSIGLRIGGSF